MIGHLVATVAMAIAALVVSPDPVAANCQGGPVRPVQEDQLWATGRPGIAEDRLLVQPIDEAAAAWRGLFQPDTIGVALGELEDGRI